MKTALRWYLSRVRSGFAASALRYYEREGLVRVGRDELGHRCYDADTVRRLIFLSRMRISGMGIDALRAAVLADAELAS